MAHFTWKCCIWIRFVEGRLTSLHNGCHDRKDCHGSANDVREMPEPLLKTVLKRWACGARAVPIPRTPGPSTTRIRARGVPLPVSDGYSDEDGNEEPCEDMRTLHVPFQPRAQGPQSQANSQLNPIAISIPDWDVSRENTQHTPDTGTPTTTASVELPSDPAQSPVTSEVLQSPVSGQSSGSGVGHAANRWLNRMRSARGSPEDGDGEPDPASAASTGECDGLQGVSADAPPGVSAVAEPPEKPDAAAAEETGGVEAQEGGGGVVDDGAAGEESYLSSTSDRSREGSKQRKRRVKGAKAKGKKRPTLGDGDLLSSEKTREDGGEVAGQDLPGAPDDAAGTEAGAGAATAAVRAEEELAAGEGAVATAACAGAGAGAAAGAGNDAGAGAGADAGFGAGAGDRIGEGTGTGAGAGAGTGHQAELSDAKSRAPGQSAAAVGGEHKTEAVQSPAQAVAKGGGGEQGPERSDTLYPVWTEADGESDGGAATAEAVSAPGVIPPPGELQAPGPMPGGWPAGTQAGDSDSDWMQMIVALPMTRDEFREAEPQFIAATSEATHVLPPGIVVSLMDGTLSSTGSSVCRPLFYCTLGQGIIRMAIQGRSLPIPLPGGKWFL